MMSPAVPYLCAAASAFTLWSSLRLRRRQRLLADLPTSKAQGVFIGLVELKGTAEAKDPLCSFLAGARCVHYAYEVQEKWSRTVTETTTDSNGKTTTTTRTEDGWKQVAHGGQTENFYLRDDTGAVLVRPGGAKLEPAVVFERTVSRSDPLYYGKGPAIAVPGSEHSRRFIEHAIVLHAPLYMVGTARERPDIVAPMITAADDGSLYLISTRSEQAVQRSAAGGSWALWALGVVLAGLAAALLAPERVSLDPVPTIAIGPGIYLGLWMTCWVWMAFNSLVSLRQRVRQGWSLIDVQLKRRHDLLPNLVAIVEGLSDHEQTTQTAVAALRAQLGATPPGVAGPDFEGLAGAVRVVAEKYPELMAQDQFAQLHRALVETEQRIALARSYYNDIATHFATRLEQIPDRWVAALGVMRPEPLLTAENFERAPVTVNFAKAH
jgi:hypothetical protein